ncbi:uncharacterized protein PGRI_055360 [Penicillium griseofulvum]|uniref:Uncharacterized protein n=1 Tax=Penicillium patulum TaxID=5078 RepID=A0A135LKW2_PENPA|nr:uncharacterized protein PGRI_055360 [Penicillium griseofulvum]KXG49568.1 hypothetical protein PGRI_055360 [Penicillium griseofulvum]
MFERRKTRKRAKVKRWLRSWVFTPLGNVRIRLINKIEWKRCRIVPDCELNRIVRGALNDRYPSRFFRDHSDLQVSSPGRRSLISTDDSSLLDLTLTSTWADSPQHQSPKLDSCVAKGPLVNGVGQDETPTHPNNPDDPSGSWQGDGYSILRITNPDRSVFNNDDEKSEDMISVFEVHRNTYELSAVRSMSPVLPAELSEETQSRQVRSAFAAFNAGMASSSVIEDLPPQLPDLYFTHQPDPPLCCLITSALRDSSVFFENGICSCTQFQQAADPLIQHAPSSDWPRLSDTRASARKSTAEVLMRHTYTRRNATLNSWHIPSNIVPRPLIIRKVCKAIRNKTGDDALMSIPEDTAHDDVTPPVHHQPYNLHCKIKNGPLPSLPPATSTSHLPSTSSPPSAAAKPTSQEAGISSIIRSSELASPSDLQQYPNRPTSMCGGCLAGRNRALHSHPYHRGDNSPQLGNPPLPYPVTPQEPTSLLPRSDSLPSSLRSGPQCRHCTTRRSGVVSPQVLGRTRRVNNSRALHRASISIPGAAPNLPWGGPAGHMGFYAASEEGFPLGGGHLDENFEMCLSAGSAARKRRYR